MKILLPIIFAFLCIPSYSTEVEVIELHENKSLDQMVLDQIENENEDIGFDDNLININEDDSNNNNENDSKENKIIVDENNIEINENFWNDVEIDYLNEILVNVENIKSNFIQNEFNNFLFDLNLNYEIKKNRDIFYSIVNYFYSVGNISRAHSMIKSRDIENDENEFFYNLIEMNYLLSTFKLEEACNFKDQFNTNGKNKENLIEKIEIFCLILQNKSSEAQLLNSIMLETEINVDENFQELFLLLNNENNVEGDKIFEFSENLNSELLFLYSAMARIAELPLNENFLKVDPINMAIPIILNKSTPIDLRIKAANLSFTNQNISIDSLAALYQSVDFNSNQLNNPESTLEQLKGKNDILMSFYFQLINIQIFPKERLEVLISFWDFARENNLEHIAYSLTFNIIESIEITSDYLKYSPQIAISYIHNKNFDKALSWINFYENTNGIDDKSSFVRILLNLYSSQELDSLVDIISNNFDKFSDQNNANNQELVFILLNILEKKQENILFHNFNNIYDERLMPSIFIIENIKKAIYDNNDELLLIYSAISLNNKEWKDIHPSHLALLLDGFQSYKNDKIVKEIVLEIFKNYKIL